jgi:AcrR family transcriptional regulator
MEMIIARSGLSTGAVYGYFKGKDEIISPEPPPLPELMGQMLGAITDFGQRRQDIDLLRVALHGWSHSQSNPELRAAARAAYHQLRELFAETVKRWQAAGTFDASTDPAATAELLTSVCLGFVAQRALAGDAGVLAHVAALETLSQAQF